MLTRDENELVTRVSAGTPMGDLMRRYWIPALMSLELPEADCPPVRVRLLGEDLVAFRDTSGRLGLIDENCPHRLASMWLGRNEENGLRCVYHGWKFDVDGHCVDQMNEPDQFAHKITIKAYPALEMGGIVWTYMGPAEKQPPAPNFEWTRLPSSQIALTKVLQECNWLQALEGGIDTSHAPILHRALKSNDPSRNAGQGVDPNSPFVRGRAPNLEVEVTNYGYRYFGVREVDGQVYVRGYHYVMPFTQIRPQQFVGDGSRQVEQAAGHFWVPMDDHNTMVWNWHYNYGGAAYTDDQRFMRGGTNGPDSVDWNNGFRSKYNRENNWGMDRVVQKTELYAGIPAGNLQDRAVQESMGSIVDRTREHLGPADKAIATTRRLLINTARALREGKDPVSAADTTYHHARAMEKMLPNDGSWHERIVAEMYPGAPVPTGVR